MEILYCKYLPYLIRFLTGRGAGSQLATDIAHQCLYHAFYDDQLGTVDRERSFWSWLCGAGRHRLLNHWRYDSRFVGSGALETTVAPSCDPDRLLDLSKRQEVVRAAYARLQARYPEPFHASIARDLYLEKCGEPRETTDAQLSAWFAESTDAVRQQRFRINRTFRKFLTDAANRLFPRVRLRESPGDWLAP